MIENLQPISDTHSISKVIAEIFFSQSFPKPNDVLEKIKKSKTFNKYQKKNTTLSKTFSLTESSFGMTENGIDGLLLESFNDVGLVDYIFKIFNQNESRSILSLENRTYSRWSAFITDLCEDLNSFTELYDSYFNAISLTYIDEFNWLGNEEIKVDKIFNKNSEILNKKFLKSRDGTIILLSQDNSSENFSEERTEITFNNHLKRIVILHKYAIRLKDNELLSVLLESENLKELFNKAHKENKKVLKDVLTKKCLDLIGVK